MRQDRRAGLLQTIAQANLGIRHDVTDSLLTSAQAGNEIAAKIIATAYLPLVKRIVQQLWAGEEVEEEKEEAVAEGTIKLMLELRSYRSDRAHFPAYAETCVRNHLIDILRRRVLETVPLSSPGDDGSLAPQETLANPDPSPEDALAEALERRERRLYLRRVLKALRSLPSADRAVLRARARGKTFAEIADGRSRQAVQQAVARAQAKLLAAVA